MRFLGIRNHHDGGVALIEDQKLVFSYEAEKDSKPRFNTCNDYSDLLRLLPECPPVDVLAYVSRNEHTSHEGYLYKGICNSFTKAEDFTVFNHKISTYESTHARAHIFSSWSMSPFPEGTPFYALIWEGMLGNFYRVDENMVITPTPNQNAEHGTVMWGPGWVYGSLFFLATRDKEQLQDISLAGKVMALAAYGRKNNKKPDAATLKALDKIFSNEYPFRCMELEALDPYFDDFNFLREGVQSPAFKDFAHLVQTRIYDTFFNYAQKNLTEKLPLVIGGGCGLNCDWNSDWKASGLFADIFVPPCTNDSGLAIGLAAEAQYYHTGKSKITWSPYAGQPFVHEDVDLSGYRETELDYESLADFLASDNRVIAWVQGACEIGPRALCHRSLIGAPFHKAMQERLNHIKKREGYRPIAPVCLEENVSDYFEWKGESPYMLHFQKVKNPAQLQAVTHVDDTARVQTVRKDQNERMYELLMAFREKTGTAVLCNTSLNFLSTGFINRTSDVVKYARQVGLDGFVIENKFYIKE